MTDEAARDIGAMVIRRTESGQDIIGPLVQAGYRAGLEEARLVLGKLSASDQADVFNVQDMLDWLDAKLKEQP